MLVHAFTIYDRKVLVYHTPFFALNDAAAMRMVADLVADKNTTVGRHPEDFVLYSCGSYNDGNGELVARPLVHVADAASFVTSDRVPSNGESV